jgi:hypothetical protein
MIRKENPIVCFVINTNIYYRTNRFIDTIVFDPQWDIFIVSSWNTILSKYLKKIPEMVVVANTSSHEMIPGSVKEVLCYCVKCLNALVVKIVNNNQCNTGV